MALYIALHSALRIEALHIEAPYKALHEAFHEALHEALHEVPHEAPHEALRKALREALHKALYEALHEAPRTEALHETLYIKALHDSSAYDGSILFSLVRVEKPRIGHFYPYQLQYFMYFLLDKGYFMLAYSHYPKPP